MSKKVIVGFFNARLAQDWFMNNGHNVNSFTQERVNPQEDDSPHIIVEMIVSTDYNVNAYLSGKIMDKP